MYIVKNAIKSRVGIAHQILDEIQESLLQMTCYSNPK